MRHFLLFLNIRTARLLQSQSIVLSNTNIRRHYKAKPERKTYKILVQ